MGEEVGVEARAEGATAIVVGPLLARGQAVGGRREKEEAAGDDVMELSVDVAAQMPSADKNQKNIDPPFFVIEPCLCRLFKTALLI